ncbi:MAG: hypothetical protein M1816_002216 [Peltula sp. TS41687]|nr:MAG: hypothetical protein M1816_002216 [Peltula sp. TS41687]
MGLTRRGPSDNRGAGGDNQRHGWDDLAPAETFLDCVRLFFRVMQDDAMHGLFPFEYASVVWARMLERCNEVFPKTAPGREEWPRTPTQTELEDGNFVPMINSRSRLEKLYRGKSVDHPIEGGDADDGRENRVSSIQLHLPKIDPKMVLAVGGTLASLLAQLGRVEPLLRPI